MVTRIYISIKLHNTGMPATFSHSTDTGLFAYPVGKRGVEELDVISPHILLHPFVEQGAEEVSPLFRTDREVCQFHRFLLVCQ